MTERPMAAPSELQEALKTARREIEAEISMAGDPEGKDQFEKGALSAYYFALSVLPVAAPLDTERRIDVEALMEMTGRDHPHDAKGSCGACEAYRYLVERGES